MLGLMLAVAGCMKVGPDFAPPTAAVSEQWMEDGDSRLDNTRSISESWWTVFEDDVLDRLIETAYRQNLPLLSAGARVLQARAQLAVAVGQFYPQTQQAFGSIDYNRRSARAPFQTGASADLLEYWQNQIGLQAAWEIDFWGRFRRAIESADAAVLASIATYDDVLVSLTADVATNYVQIRTLQARLKIARENVEVQRESLNIAEIRFRAGTTSERDVQQARTVLASTEASIPQLEAALGQTKNALSVLLGMPPSPLDELLGGVEGDSGGAAAGGGRNPGRSATPAPGHPGGRAAGRGAKRADRRRQGRPLSGLLAHRQLRISRERLERIRSLGHLPRQEPGFSFGPSFQWNILNYGRITNNVRVQDAAFQALVTDYQNTVLDAPSRRSRTA